MIGLQFGEWPVENYAFATDKGCWYWCQCSCGTKKPVLGVELRRGKTKSCGHNGAKFNHGSARRGHKSREYNIWVMMRNRCKNKNNESYKNYGARGIRVCTRWDSFENFLADMGKSPSSRHTLDRFPNNDGNYEPSNCRWATASGQRRNSRRIIMISHDDQTMCLKDWCKHLNLPYSRVFYHVSKGRSVANMLFGEGG